jgi:hypothetical protein
MWTTAVTTLLAVGVGGLVTYVVQVRLEDRRIAAAERAEQAKVEREAAAEQLRIEKEMRVANRLLLEELDTLVVHHQLLLEAKTVPDWTVEDNGVRFLSTEVWQSYQPILAREIADDVWDVLATYMNTVPRLRAMLRLRGPRQDLDAELAHIERSLELATDAYLQLAGELPPSLTTE